MTSVPIENCGGDIIQLIPAAEELNTFYGVSALSKLVRIDVSKPFLESLAPPHTNEMEVALYCRDFDKVYKCLLEVSNTSQDAK